MGRAATRGLGVLAFLGLLAAFQWPAQAKDTSEADMAKVTSFLERRQQGTGAEVESAVDEIVALVANGQLAKQEAADLLLLAHEQALMEIGAVAGEKFAAQPSCGRGTPARDQVVMDLRRRALRHAEPWSVVANAVAVMDATCAKAANRQ